MAPVAAGTDASGPATWSKTAGTRRLTGLATVGDYNPAGQAAGNNTGKLVLRESNGGLVPIPVAVGTRWSDASDVNNMDEVVGSSRDTINNQLHAWVWRRETGTENAHRWR